jgi:hypothetical protein
MGSELPQALQVSDQPRHLRLHRYQWIGLPLLFLVPILALLGTFGDSTDREADATAELALAVEYPARHRFKQIHTVEVRVENLSGRVLDTIVVSFDPEYVLRFSGLAFIPGVEEPFEVVLRDVQPGEIRLVVAELQSEEYGRHTGEVRAHAVGAVDTAAVVLSTLIFP